MQEDIKLEIALSIQSGLIIPNQPYHTPVPSVYLTIADTQLPALIGMILVIRLPTPAACTPCITSATC
ncbi:MAG: hypothetical protein HRU04_08805 [Oceanospirillaceae bacterium]|nr:hypothetical protein [Oceanospirillaceae bacterium]